MAKVRTTISFDEEIVNQIDTQAQDWYSDRSSALQRIFLEWKESRSAAPTPTDQPRVVTINGVTYTQIDMPEAA